MKTLLQLSLIFALFAQTTLSAQNSQYVLNFDGSDSQTFKYVDDASSSMMDGATDYTIEVWVKPTSATIHNKVIIKLWNSFALTLYKDADKRVYFTHYGASSTYVNSKDNVINLNEWNHIAVICNSSENKTQLYVNGVDVSLESYPALTLVGGNDDDNFYAGYGGDGYPDMMLREVRLKKVAENIANLHTEISDSNYTKDDDTALLFQFREGSGTTTKNEVGDNSANLGWGDPAGHFPTWVEFSTTLSAHKYNTTTFNIFPNPSVAKEFVIQANSNETIQKVEMFDILGKAVKTIDYDNNINNINIGVQDLQTGIYFVKTSTDKGIGTRKIIIR